MRDTNNIVVVGQLDGDTLSGLERNSRRIMRPDEVAGLVHLTDEMGGTAEVSKEALAAQKAIQRHAQALAAQEEARQARERFWYALVPGRRTAQPAERHFQPRYDNIQKRRKLKTPRQRDLAAQGERRALGGWVNQYLLGEITPQRLLELGKRIGADQWHVVAVARRRANKVIAPTDLVAKRLLDLAPVLNIG